MHSRLVIFIVENMVVLVAVVLVVHPHGDAGLNSPMETLMQARLVVVNLFKSGSGPPATQRFKSIWSV